MTREELRDYVDEQRTLNNIPYHVYSALIDGIDTLEQEPTTKNDLGVDCISRDEVCRYVAEFVNHEFSTKEEEELIDNIITGIERMPSVTPQEPKTGHWVEYTRVLIPEPINKWEQAWYCSECGYGNQDSDESAWLEWNYCPNCGAKMVEPQESEDKE